MLLMTLGRIPKIFQSLAPSNNRVCVQRKRNERADKTPPLSVYEALFTAAEVWTHTWCPATDACTEKLRQKALGRSCAATDWMESFRNCRILDVK